MNCIGCGVQANLRLCMLCLKDDTITITCSKARKQYKLDLEDLSILEMTKKRYYIPDIINNLAIINEQKELKLKVKKEESKRERAKRIEHVKSYLDTKEVKFVNFVIKNCQDITELYCNGGLIEDLDSALQSRYDKYEQQQQCKKQRGDDIRSVIDKHEMKNFKIYEDKLKSKIIIYEEDENLDLVSYFLIIQEEYNRTKELYDKFNERGIEPRLDSYLCNKYIDYGLQGVIGNTNDMGIINCVDDIVDIMYCLHFLYNNTCYKKTLDYVHRNLYNYDFGTNLANEARKMALEDWCDQGNSKDELPNRLKHYV